MTIVNTLVSMATFVLCSKRVLFVVLNTPVVRVSWWWWYPKLKKLVHCVNQLWFIVNLICICVATTTAIEGEEVWASLSRKTIPLWSLCDYFGLLKTILELHEDFQRQCIRFSWIAVQNQTLFENVKQLWGLKKKLECGFVSPRHLHGFISLGCNITFDCSSPRLPV